MEKKFPLFILLFFYHIAFASHVGVIVKKEGESELLTNPSQSAHPKDNVLYNGVYYQIKKTRLGLKVENGNIVRTKGGSKLKIVFKNGDQFLVSPATSYKVQWAKNQKKSQGSSIELMYGKIRGVISKSGPRSGTKVKTKHAVMGIRGTDFHISQNGTSGKSVLNVIRGKVEVTSKESKKKVEVSQGKSAEVLTQNKKSSLELTKITQSELKEIHKESEIKQSEKIADQGLAKQIKELEKKSFETTLNDIKEYQPKLYEKIKEKKTSIDSDELNKVSVAVVYDKAPKKKIKVGLEDIKYEIDPYKEYFEVEDL